MRKGKQKIRNFASEMAIIRPIIDILRSTRTLGFFLLLFFAVCPAPARETTACDSIKTPGEDRADTKQSAAAVPDSVKTDAKKQGDIFSRIIAYFDDTNKPKENKTFDFSIIGGPHYSSDAGFGIGLLAAGLYHTDPADTITPPSSVSIFADATTNKYFNIGVEGYHLFARDTYRLTYECRLQSLSTKFWGIGYKQEICDDNESKYDYLRVKVNSRFLFHPGRHIYMGPKFVFDYVHGRNFEKPWLWADESAVTTTFGPGFSFQFDSRDNLSNAWSGLYIALDQDFFPAFIGNKHAYSRTELTVSGYHRVWRGGVLAWRGHTSIGYGDMLWSQLSELGDGHSMRGYYQGRYRDKCSWDACIELRQHVWRRNGIALWLGCGEVFRKISLMRFDQILPNAGVGYRWEFKHRVNIRIDVGFGRDGAGFMFNINEAF